MQWNIIKITLTHLIRNKMCLCKTKVPENRFGKSYFYFRVYIKSYALFPYLLNDLNEIRYRRPPGNATELWISYKSEWGKACCSNGRKLNYIHACTVKRYSISKAKDELVSTAYGVTE
jgi:hypothetical protein